MRLSLVHMLWMILLLEVCTLGWVVRAFGQPHESKGSANTFIESTVPRQTEVIRPWPKGTITYSDRTDSPLIVRLAVWQINRLELGITLKAVKSGTADIDISTQKGSPCISCTGRASSIGFVSGSQHTVILAPFDKPLFRNHIDSSWTLLVLHETSHLLGLEHVERGCSVMYHFINQPDCTDLTQNPQRGDFWCGYSKEDVDKLSRLYKVKAVKAHPLCPSPVLLLGAYQKGGQKAMLDMAEKATITQRENAAP